MYTKISKRMKLVFSICSALSLTSCFDTKSPHEQQSENTLQLNQQAVRTTKSLTDVDQQIELKIKSLISQMTLAEKIGQTALRGTSSREKGKVSDSLINKVKNGQVGAFLNVMNNSNVDLLQKVAVEQSRLGIPLIFGRDVIHGFKTIFPIPLAMASSWNTDVAKEASRISAQEASTMGIRWTFAPMVDISRDARWGRIAESLGEDPYLSSQLAIAMVQGFQGDDMTKPTSMAATVKHFAAYGAAEGGRDYNTVSMSENDLRDIYLPPFKAAADAGAASFMNAFNEVNGVPATGNKLLLKKILRDEWQYDGFVVSDWNSVPEMISHGYTKDLKQAAYRAASAGMDMEMTSTAYDEHLADLIAEGKIDEQQLNNFVANILRIKFRLGLFDNPYRRTDGDDDILSAENLAAAKEAAVQSMVLLKNDNVNNQALLPLSKQLKSIAVIGPLANAPHDQMGTWVFDGRAENSVTPLMSLEQRFPNKINYASGLEISRTQNTDGFADAIAAAKKSEVILFFAGEESILSGEAHSRANIDLPGAQEQLIHTLAEQGKPIVLVVLAGRPITLGNILDKVDAVLFAWHPGTMAGPAITDLVFGDRSPSGRLPVTWPKQVGQIPIYYNYKNTGRPAVAEDFVQMYDIPVNAWQSSLGNDSHYLDLGFAPQYPFGYGLTYSSVEYSNLKLDKSEVALGGSIRASVTITNTGSRKVTEVAQLYTQDLFADITRPVKELKGFKRVTLAAGESQSITFTLHTKDLAFHNQEMQLVTEAGEFNLWIGENAAQGLQTKFSLAEK